MVNKDERRRKRFEEKVFAQRFLQSVQRVNDGQFGLQPVDCPMKAEFVAKDADGNYLEGSLNPAWWAWNAALDSTEVQLPEEWDAAGDGDMVYEVTKMKQALDDAGIRYK